MDEDLSQVILFRGIIIEARLPLNTSKMILHKIHQHHAFPLTKMTTLINNAANKNGYSAATNYAQPM